MTHEDAMERGARCHECYLYKTNQGGPVGPEVNRKATFALVGEAPGGDEVQTGRPFTGKSGQELTTSLHSVGISRGDATLVNCVACRPPGNDMEMALHKCQQENKQRVANGEEPWLTPIEACRPMMYKDLEKHDKILTVGKWAMRSVTCSGSSIMDMRGAPVTAVLAPVLNNAPPMWMPRDTLDPAPDDVALLTQPGAKWMRLLPTIHPAFVMRQRRWTKVFRSDIARAGRWFSGHLAWREPNTIYIPTLSQARDFLYSGAPFYSYDVETDAKESLIARLRCIGFATGPDGLNAMVVPFLSIDGFTRFYTEDEAGAMADLLCAWFTDRRILKAGWNCGVYDRIVVEQQMGVTPAPIADGILFHRNIDTELPHNLAFVGALLTDVARAWKASHGATQSETDEQLWSYNVGDVVVNARIMEPLVQAAALKSQSNVVVFDHRIQANCVGMHRNGLLVDQDKRRELLAKYRAEAIEHLHALRQITGNEAFNPNSTLQMRKLLFNTWGFTPIELTKLGDPSTNDATLRKLLRQQNIPKERGQALREMRGFRHATKFCGTFLVPLRPQGEAAYQDDLSVDVNTVEGAALFDEEAPADEDDLAELSAKRAHRAEKKKEGLVLSDGRVHSSWNCHVPNTHRLSSSSPNVTNFVRILRSVFVPQPGCAYVYADEDQLELRIIAGFAGAARYLEQFRDPNGDPHTVTAEALYGDTFRHAVGENRKKIRDFAKRFVYASSYWATVDTIHETLTAVENDKGELVFPWLTLRETGVMYDRWISENPEIPKWWEDTLNVYRRDGFLQDPALGTRCYFMDGEDPNQIVNWRVQTTGAVCVAKAMVSLSEGPIPYEKWGPGTGIVHNGHDSLMAEVPCKHGSVPADKDGKPINGYLGWHPKLGPGEKCLAIDAAFALKEHMSMPLPGYESLVNLTAKPKIGFNAFQVA